MTSTDIYSLLSSKSHNKHHLKRYYTFILACIQINSTKTKEELGYTEKHHICPKASDLFPEYKSFRKNQWNKALLTGKQHKIAHILLWKSYGGSQTTAFWRMGGKSPSILYVKAKQQKSNSLLLSIQNKEHHWQTKKNSDNMSAI